MEDDSKVRLLQTLCRGVPDVLIVGGGMAALCAAISARCAGASVFMAEAAPRALRGGNTRHSRNLRVMHDAPTKFIPGSYPEADFLADIRKTSEGAGDEELTRLLVHHSSDILDWLADKGIAFQTKHIPFSRKTAFFLGGGKMAINALYATAERLGVHIAYDFPVNDLRLDCSEARTIIVCSGGAQAALAEGFINRGTPFADGKVLHGLLEQGIVSVGEPGASHLVAVDARFADHDGGIVTRVDGMEHGIVVDMAGRRFQDEQAITGPTRYSTWGKSVANLPGRWAALIMDADGIVRAPPSALPPIQATSMKELADILGMDDEQLTLSANQSGRVARQPFFAFPIRPGVAFTCQGVKVDKTARLVKRDGTSLSNIFAAGVIMAPNILGTGYLAGGGLSVGAVFGRLAGEEAARHALG